MRASSTPSSLPNTGSLKGSLSEAAVTPLTYPCAATSHCLTEGRGPQPRPRSRQGSVALHG